MPKTGAEAFGADISAATEISAPGVSESGMRSSSLSSNNDMDRVLYIIPKMDAARLIKE